MPTHVVVRLAPKADDWQVARFALSLHSLSTLELYLQLHSIIVCDEELADNSVFYYKDWLKSSCPCVTLGLQGKFSVSGMFSPVSVSTLSSSFELSIKKIDKLAVPEGFSKVLLKFDDAEVRRAAPWLLSLIKAGFRPVTSI
jgi:hypothetical protein